MRLPFDSVVGNLSADIWVLFSAPITCTIIGNSSQHITLLVHHPWLPRSLCFSFVHARCTMKERRILWQDLLTDKPTSLPWCVCGDFNVIIDPHEKRGGRPFARAEGMELLSFMEEAEVFDAGFSGSSYTWCNNRRGRERIWKRLDRLLINGIFSDAVSSVSVAHLARHPSDHAPLRIGLASRMDNKPRPFRFLNLWTDRKDLLEVIRNAWQLECTGSPLRKLCSKLVKARRVIQEWNKEAFGNIFIAVQRAESDLLAAENRVEEEDESGDAQSELQKAQAKLRLALSNEERFWSQKALLPPAVPRSISRFPSVSGKVQIGLLWGDVS
ncbi:uncharacterized protein [Coffea arabica]|uniref:Endonuclease/exonuclease/phosphatase domain-containing protein n=1 Tax=Coffea arabica TaxID=13443 RepID=A0ABM4VH80_COFAR